MILVFNALNVRPGVHDGAAAFAVNLLHRLPAALPEARIVALVQPGEDRVSPAQNLELRELGGTGSAPGRVVTETLLLSRELRRLRADVLLAPFESIPVVPPCPVVCVAQNLVYHCNDFFGGYLGSSSAERALSRAQGIYYRRRMRSAYRRAAAVVTVSAETLRVLAASAGLDPAKATVVHEGCDSIFLPPPGGEVRREPRLLAVGTLAPYKNHERAIDLFARLVPARPELTLELVGSDWRGYGDVVARHAAQSGVGARIRFSHDLASREVAERYQSSTLLLHLSSCESFGLPVVEAMRYGLPVVAAARSSLPEVAGGAALLVDPDDPAAAAAAVEGLLADEALLGALAAKGRAHAGELTWKRAAEGVAAVVQRVVSPGGRSSTPA